jgi:MYXO-CTERM domain-containing protein
VSAMQLDTDAHTPFTCGVVTERPDAAALAAAGLVAALLILRRRRKTAQE